MTHYTALEVEEEMLRMERRVLRLGLPLAPSPTPQLENEAENGDLSVAEPKTERPA